MLAIIRLYAKAAHQRTQASAIDHVRCAHWSSTLRRPNIGALIGAHAA
jgi:hypothetical protein